MLVGAPQKRTPPAGTKTAAFFKMPTPQNDRLS